LYIQGDIMQDAAGAIRDGEGLDFQHIVLTRRSSSDERFLRGVYRDHLFDSNFTFSSSRWSRHSHGTCVHSGEHGATQPKRFP
jgi:hypothetical protein